MGRKVLIVSSSLREGSNTEFLANEALKGAKDAQGEVELVSLKGKDIKFCIGCLACQKADRCVIRDDMDELIGKVKEAESIIFVTPIYYYEMSGQLKTFLDRCNPLYAQDYSFRNIYLITASAEPGDEPAKRAVEGIKGWTACFKEASFKGGFNAGGVDAPNMVESLIEDTARAYAIGRAAAF